MVSRKMLKAPWAEDSIGDSPNEHPNVDPDKDSTLDKLPKILASTKKSTRHKGMQALSLWLMSRQASEEDLKKVWKGLFYAVWHADKAPVQDELVTRVARLMLCLTPEAARSFLQVFLWTMRREWSGIDRLRLDKFYLLLRTFLRTTLEYLQKAKWNPSLVASFMQVYSERTLGVKDNHAALGVNLHLADTFLEEVNSFSLDSATAFLLLEPFLRVLAHSQDKVLLPRIESAVFGALIDERKRDDDASAFSRALDFDQLASRLFAIASAPETAPKNRAVLYALHAHLKREGGEQNGGKSHEEAAGSEEPPVKENGKRGAPVTEMEKQSKKKRKDGGKGTADTALETESVKRGRNKTGGLNAENRSIQASQKLEPENNTVADTSNGTEGKVKKRKKGGEEEHTNKESTFQPASVEPNEGPLTGGDVTRQRKGKRKQARSATSNEGVAGCASEEPSLEGTVVSRRAAKVGKQEMDEALLERVRGEAAGAGGSGKTQAEGTGGVKKVHKSMRVGPKGGSEELVEVPPAATKSETPDRKKLLKAALKRATAAGIKETAGEGGLGEESLAQKKSRKRAADVVNAGPPKTDGANVRKSDAIAAIEEALNDLRNVVPPEKEQRARAKKGARQVEAGAPSTPVGEVEFESPATISENDSAAKRRKSGAGATPAVAPKSDAASKPVVSGSAVRDEAGAASLGARFSEVEAQSNGRPRRRKAEASQGSGRIESALAGEVVALQTPGGGSIAGALVLAPHNVRGQPFALNGSLTKKKVRFSLKSNLEFKFGSPLPEKTTRTPPAATPRGSALKVKGPSPIRRQGASLVDGFPLGSRRNKKRQGPILIHLAGVRGQEGRPVRGWSQGKGAGRGQGRRGRRRMQVR